MFIMRTALLLCWYQYFCIQLKVNEQIKKMLRQILQNAKKNTQKNLNYPEDEFLEALPSSRKTLVSTDSRKQAAGEYDE